MYLVIGAAINIVSRSAMMTTAHGKNRGSHGCVLESKSATLFLVHQKRRS